MRSSGCSLPECVATEYVKKHKTVKLCVSYIFVAFFAWLRNLQAFILVRVDMTVASSRRTSEAVMNKNIFCLVYFIANTLMITLKLSQNMGRMSVRTTQTLPLEKSIFNILLRGGYSEFY